MIPPQEDRFCVQNFWEKSLKVETTSKNRFKNSGKKSQKIRIP
jgi:hypothetical protein